MKKIVSLFAVIATFCVMTTSVFAWSLTGTVDGTGASISDTTITAGAEGFVFKYIGDSINAGGTSTADLTKLVADGWTISEVETQGLWCYKADGVTQNFTSGKVKVQFASSQHSDAAGQPYLMFKATPSASSTFENLTFTVTPMFSLNNVGGSGLYRTATTYTVVKAAPQEKKTTATIGANGVVEFDYADADVADAKLNGKKVVLGTAYAGNLITADTTVKVTYTPVEGAAETKTFGETLFEKLDVEGFGFLETESITFGIVCDTTMTGTFSFALN